MKFTTEEFNAATILTVDMGYAYETDAVCLVKRDGKYHIFCYGGCSCPSFEDMAGLPDPIPDWSGTLEDLAIAVILPPDIHMPGRALSEQDSDYPKMHEFWSQVEELLLKGAL